MTIADQITRLNNAKANIKQAIINKGVEVDDNALLDEYPALISSIPMEGGDPYYEEFYNMRTNNGTNMDSLFARTSGELDLRKVDVGNVTSMKYMFDNSTAFVNIDGWDTSKVTDMSYMFNMFTGSIDVSKLNTSKVTNAEYMFYYANTDNIILTGMSFPSIKSLGNMFYNATGTTLDLSSWDISNITSMSNMFSSAKHKRIDLTGWKTSNVTDMSSMFYTYNSPLVELIIPDWDMTNCNHNIFYSSSYIPNLKLIDLSRSNDATITKIASFLPKRTTTTYGKVIVPYDTSQATYDALIAKYWAPIGAALSPVPTSIEIAADLDEIYPGKSTKVYIGACEPWNADSSKVELVISDDSMATITDDNEVISIGVLGDIKIEARIIDTQEVVGTKTISVSETDSYPGLIKFRAASTPYEYGNVITVNNSGKRLSNLTYDSITDIYSYDAGVPITSIRFDGSYSYISELIKLDTSNVTTMYEMFNNCNKLITLDLSNFNTSNVTNMGRMFYDCNSLTSIGDVSNWDTSNVTNMTCMFWNCQSITSLDLSNWHTSNVTNVSQMFNKCSSLTSLDISNFDIRTTDRNWILTDCTSLHTLRLDNCNNTTINMIITSEDFPTNAIEGVTRTIYCKEENAAGLTPPTNWVFSYVTEEEPEVPVDPPAGDIPLYVPGEFQYNMEATEVRTMVDESHNDLSNMFNFCMNLVSVNTEDWDTSNVTNMSSMFSGCHSLPSLDVSNFNTSNVTNMYSMFQGCASLTSLDVSGWDTSNVTDMSSMFSNCYLTSLDVSNWDTGKVTNMSSMFGYCGSLTSIGDVSNWDTSKATNMSSMFSGCYLTSLDVSKWDISKVTNMDYMFQNCHSLTSLDLSDWDTSNVTNMEDMFSGCYSLTELHLDNCSNDTISKIITSSNFPTDVAMDGGTRTIYCKKENVAGLTPPTNWVFSCDEEEPEVPEEPSIPLYVSGEFKDNTEITEVRTMVDESHDDLSYMFSNCSNLVSVNTEDWETGNVTNMSWMFSNCASLQLLDVSNWDTGKATAMNYMFHKCINLTSLDVSKWDTSNVTNMNGMFNTCQSLTSLDLSNFDTSKSTSIGNMFTNCQSLTSLDLSNFNTSIVVNISNMFNYCSNLTSIDISNFDISEIRVSKIGTVFSGCTALHTLRLDNCSNDTISKIITSKEFPTDAIEGVTRTIYCKEANAAGLTAPTNWVFSYVN